MNFLKMGGQLSLHFTELFQPSCIVKNLKYQYKNVQNAFLTPLPNKSKDQILSPHILVTLSERHMQLYGQDFQTVFAVM